MIDKKLVKSLVDEWLDGKDYFLTDLTVSTDDRIVVEIDHQDGVWIEDCVELSKFIEAHLARKRISNWKWAVPASVSLSRCADSMKFMKATAWKC